MKHSLILLHTTGKLGDTVWNGDRKVTDFHGLDPEALHAVIKWCYTTRLEVPVSRTQDTQGTLSSLQLHDLARQLSADTVESQGCSRIWTELFKHHQVKPETALR